MEIHQKISVSNDQKMQKMVQRRMDQKLRFRNFDARHGRVETCVVVKNRIEKEGQCSRRDTCSFRHETNDSAHKSEHNVVTLSESSQSRGECVEEKKYPQQK